MSMGEGGTDGVKIGVQIFFVAAIVGVGIIIFLLGKNLINGGLDTLETTVQRVDDAQFSDFVNQTVKGSRIKSALQNFSGKEYAILVGNLTYIDKTRGNLSDSDTYSKTNEGAIAIKGGNSVEIIVDEGGTPTPKTAYFVNYNAIIGGEPGSDSFTGLVKDPSTGDYIYSGAFELTSAGDVAYFLQTMSTKKKGNDHYIADSSMYESSLIKNPSGEIMGIVFVQKEIH